MPTVRSWEEEGAGRLRVETAGEDDAPILGLKLRVC